MSTRSFCIFTNDAASATLFFSESFRVSVMTAGLSGYFAASSATTLLADAVWFAS